MAFPDERDRKIIAQATAVERLASDVCEWLAINNPERKAKELLPVKDDDEFEVLHLRRLAGNLYNSARVPVAAAVYGPSQVGKSLFIGQVLQPHSDDYTPLGRDETHGPPAYYEGLSFHHDLNPQAGENEATALVTRFSTKERIAESVSPSCPVMVRALTRAEWLRVLARGFHAECKPSEHTWGKEELEELFEALNSSSAGKRVDRQWRMDLLDAFTYMRGVDRRGFKAPESILNGLLSRYPLSEEGYRSAAAHLFWDNWSDLTGLFMRINDFLTRISRDADDPAIHAHWAGVRFLLDSQRKPVHQSRVSRCFERVQWSDFHLRKRGEHFLLEYDHRSDSGTEDLATIQASMLELVVPVLPHRLNEDWRKVIEQIDLLDIPGMRAIKAGVQEGQRTSAETLEEQMAIVKRGKVAYLFERFTEELQIQTLFLLQRGGNLEVSAQMKHHINKWGKSRYGGSWPLRVHDDMPSLFIGMTGIDLEFRNREEFATTDIYQARLNQLADALGKVMTNFGGPAGAFTNVYPIRYPGTWDTDESQRRESDPQKWVKAREAFLQSKMVQRHVRSPDQRWDAAMADDDGGLSLISAGIRRATSAEKKQDQMEENIQSVKNRLLNLARDWVVNPSANADRETRVKVAKAILQWLASNEELVYPRVHALQQSLCVAEGDELTLADCAEVMGTRHGDPVPKQLESFLHNWATKQVPQRWAKHTAEHTDGEPWPDTDEFSLFTRYLRDYLLTKGVFEKFAERLSPVVRLKTKDEAARRRARRKYVRIMLNDFVINPGLSLTPIKPRDEGLGTRDEGRGTREDKGFPQSPVPSPQPLTPSPHPQDVYERFGLMATFVRRWTDRVPQALASAGGEHTSIPPGNRELIDILLPFIPELQEMLDERDEGRGTRDEGLGTRD